MTTGVEWVANGGSFVHGHNNPSEGWLFVAESSLGLTRFDPALLDRCSESIPDLSTAYNPMPGDNIFPINAVDAKLVNGISLPISASAGWSSSPPRYKFHPSDISFDVRIHNQNHVPSLELILSIDYSNPFPGQSMMVNVSVAKTKLFDQQVLLLVSTKFQDFTENGWIDIPTNVEYVKSASAVVHSVIADATAGQTAGMATDSVDSIDVTLGPFEKRGRVILTFQCQSMYSYDMMSTELDGSGVGKQRLAPVLIHIPWAPLHHAAGLCSFSLRFSAPKDATILPLQSFAKAYHHLAHQPEMFPLTVIAKCDLDQKFNDNNRTGFTLQCSALPPRSCAILTWLQLPNRQVDDIFSFDTKQLNAVIQVPSGYDKASLQVPLPGHGSLASLYRIQLSIPSMVTRSPDQVRFILNLNISDASGSTGIICDSTGATIRERFNEMSESRFLKRLQSIPALVAANVLSHKDVWMDMFLPFQDRPRPIQKVSFQVGDAINQIGGIVDAVRSNVAFPGALFRSIREYVLLLRACQSNGGTNFKVAADAAVNYYDSCVQEYRRISSSTDNPLFSTFIEFDTDGGDNNSAYQESIRKMIGLYNVNIGIVTGFGAWVDQDCASTVASMMGEIPAQLSLYVPKPGDEGMDHVFRTSFAAWISSLHHYSYKVNVSAGSVPVLNSTKNALEVVAIRRIRGMQSPHFCSPDVSNVNFTKTNISVAAGDELMLYVASRICDPDHLAESLQMSINGLESESPSAPAAVSVKQATESLESQFIAFDWLTVLCELNSDKVVLNPLLARSLQYRLEDEISFRFNIASPSGSTAYLGRSLTSETRQPIDSSHQAPPAPKFNFVPRIQSNLRSGFHHAPAPKFKFGPSIQSNKNSSFQHSSGIFNSPTMFGSSSTCIPFGAASTATTFGCAAPSSSSSSQFGVASTSFGSASTSFGAASTSFGAASTSFGANGSSFQFGAAAPTGFGSADPSSGLFGFPQSSTHSWLISMTEPISGTLSVNVLDTFDSIRLAGQKLLNSPGIIFYCDQCRNIINFSQKRFHCFDCDDYDECGACTVFDNHVRLNPLHRIAEVTSARMAVQPAPVSNSTSDLTNLLLGPAVSAIKSSSNRPDIDWSREVARRQLQRFLHAVLDWWPMILSLCRRINQLPGQMPDDMIQKIRASLDPAASFQQLVDTSAIIVDTISRSQM